MADKENQINYDVSSIQALEGIEHVRKRPGMYVGGTDIKALHHLVYEVVDNAIDEALAGVCDRIDITIHPDSSVTIEDNGRGIPVGPHPTKKDANGKPMETLDVVMTVIGAGGKFGGGGYKVSGGLHGVGVSVTNALSKRLEVTVWREGQVASIVFSGGDVIEPLVISEAGLGERRSGTVVRVWPDAKYFESAVLPRA